MFFLGQIDCNKERNFLIINWVFKTEIKLSFLTLFTGGKKCLEKLLTFASQVLWKCSFWVHSDGAVQMFYLTPTRDRFSGKFVKWVRFLAVFQEYIFCNVKRSEAWKVKFLSKTVLWNKWSLLLVFIGFKTIPENLKLIDKQLQIKDFELFAFWFKFYFLRDSFREF